MSICRINFKNIIELLHSWLLVWLGSASFSYKGVTNKIVVKLWISVTSSDLWCLYLSVLKYVPLLLFNNRLYHELYKVEIVTYEIQPSQSRVSHPFQVPNVLDLIRRYKLLNSLKVERISYQIPIDFHLLPRSWW